MDATTVIIFAAITLLFILIGFWKDQDLLIALGGLGLFFLGIFVIIGINYVSSDTTLIVDNVTTMVTHNVDVYHSDYNYIILFFCSLIGVLMCVIAGTHYKDNKKFD